MHHVITLQTKYYLAPNDNCVRLDKSFSSYVCIYWDLFFSTILINGKNIKVKFRRKYLAEDWGSML